jgi:hypothetical protein
VKEDPVQRINWGRVFLCGLVAGLVWTVLSSGVTVFAGQGFSAAVPGNKLAAPTGGLITFLFVVNLAKGVWAMWLYAAIRPRYGPGPKTAVIAGLSWWFISSLIDVTWGSFGFVPARTLLGPMAASLPAITLAALAGAWCYKEYPARVT